MAPTQLSDVLLPSPGISIFCPPPSETKDLKWIVKEFNLKLLDLLEERIIYHFPIDSKYENVVYFDFLDILVQYKKSEATQDT